MKGASGLPEDMRSFGVCADFTVTGAGVSLLHAPILSTTHIITARKLLLLFITALPS
jgi:hypothetical protein